jgi:hypothetical protein
MRNKKAVFIVSFIIITLAIALSAILPEKKFFHIGYQAIILAVVLLSIYLPIRDVMIILMISSCVVWSMGFFEVVSDLHPLILETAVVLAASFALGWFELAYEKEKKQMDAVVDYKKKENAELTGKITQLNRDNQAILDETKSVRKIFNQ